MGFQIKDFISVVAGMINHMRGANSAITDYNVGSVARTLVEAPAVEIEELYLQMVNGLTESIPIAVYRAFEFHLLPATYASGYLQLTAGTPALQDVPVPAGTRFRVPGSGVVYASTEEAVLAAGETSLSVIVQASVLGSAGNALPLSITELETPIAGIDAVTNPTAIVGRDRETEAERKVRFLGYIRNLARGTLGALEYAARLAVVRDAAGGIIEYVDRVGLVEEIPGRVSLYVYNGQGGTTDALVAAAQRIIDGYEEGGTKVAGYRSAGCSVTCRPMAEQAVDLTLEVTPSPGYALDDAMRAGLYTAFSAHLAGLLPGEPLYLSRLIAALLNVAGVNAIDIAEPADNVAVPQTTVLVAGGLTAT